MKISVLGDLDISKQCNEETQARKRYTAREYEFKPVTCRDKVVGKGAANEFMPRGIK